MMYERDIFRVATQGYDLGGLKIFTVATTAGRTGSSTAALDKKKNNLPFMHVTGK